MSVAVTADSGDYAAWRTPLSLALSLVQRVTFTGFDWLKLIILGKMFEFTSPLGLFKRSRSNKLKPFLLRAENCSKNLTEKMTSAWKTLENFQKQMPAIKDRSPDCWSFFLDQILEMLPRNSAPQSQSGSVLLFLFYFSVTNLWWFIYLVVENHLDVTQRSAETRHHVRQNSSFDI